MRNFPPFPALPGSNWYPFMPCTQDATDPDDPGIQLVHSLTALQTFSAIGDRRQAYQRRRPSKTGVDGAGRQTFSYLATPKLEYRRSRSLPRRAGSTAAH